MLTLSLQRNDRTGVPIHWFSRSNRKCTLTFVTTKSKHVVCNGFLIYDNVHINFGQKRKKCVIKSKMCHKKRPPSQTMCCTMGFLIKGPSDCLVHGYLDLQRQQRQMDAQNAACICTCICMCICIWTCSCFFVFVFYLYLWMLELVLPEHITLVHSGIYHLSPPIHSYVGDKLRILLAKLFLYKLHTVFSQIAKLICSKLTNVFDLSRTYYVSYALLLFWHLSPFSSDS